MIKSTPVSFDFVTLAEAYATVFQNPCASKCDPKFRTYHNIKHEITNCSEILCRIGFKLFESAYFHRLHLFPRGLLGLEDAVAAVPWRLNCKFLRKGSSFRTARRKLASHGGSGLGWFHVDANVRNTSDLISQLSSNRTLKRCLKLYLQETLNAGISF